MQRCAPVLGAKFGTNSGFRGGAMGSGLCSLPNNIRSDGVEDQSLPTQNSCLSILLAAPSGYATANNGLTPCGGSR
jgi:hypothetical protein